MSGYKLKLEGGASEKRVSGYKLKLNVREPYRVRAEAEQNERFGLDGVGVLVLTASPPNINVVHCTAMREHSDKAHSPNIDVVHCTAMRVEHSDKAPPWARFNVPKLHFAVV